ncbi:hypothetical protein CRENBAI_000013 [Crenichthys baileyi]|uniref:Uncharacterized protein n=1 Tax=Crenichthys baileyi TaxID=28760 RepID=A0AAV9SSA7_9TELE
MLQRLSFWKVLLSPQRNAGALTEPIGFSVIYLTKDLLVTVFENDRLMQDYSLEEIRKHAMLQDEKLNPNLYNHEQKLLHNHIISRFH